MKKYAFYSSDNVVKQTIIADLDVDTLAALMSDYEILFGIVGVQEYEENDDIQIGWSVETHSPVEIIQEQTDPIVIQEEAAE